MVQENILIVSNHGIDVMLKTLDIDQIEILDLYNKALNIENIRNLLIFTCGSKGFLSYLDKDDSTFFVSLKKYKENCQSHNNENLQARYNDAVIFLVKKMLTAYHKKEVLKTGFWFEEQKSFDPQCLTKKERGILTKILKLENKRLEKMGIKNRRQKKAYYNRIFLSSFA